MKRSPPSRWSGLHHTHLLVGVSCVSTPIGWQQGLVQYVDVVDTCKVSRIL